MVSLLFLRLAREDLTSAEPHHCTAWNTVATARQKNKSSRCNIEHLCTLWQHCTQYILLWPAVVYNSTDHQNAHCIDFTALSVGGWAAHLDDQATSTLLHSQCFTHISCWCSCYNHFFTDIFHHIFYHIFMNASTVFGGALLWRLLTIIVLVFNKASRCKFKRITITLWLTRFWYRGDRVRTDDKLEWSLYLAFSKP